MISFETSTDPDLMLLAVVLAELRAHADRCNADLLLIGAAARNVLIRHVTGSAPQRATADIDIAVAVGSWDQIGSPGLPWRLYTRRQSAGGTPREERRRRLPPRSATQGVRDDRSGAYRPSPRGY